MTEIITTRSLHIGELAGALAKAQGQIKGAIKDSENPFFKSKYADLASVWEACREPLSTNELAVVQAPATPFNSEAVRLITTIMHSSGQWISGDLEWVPMKSDPQGGGSLISYMRRYSLAAMVGVCPEDDDGNAASMKSGTIRISKDVSKKVVEQSLACLERDDAPGLKEIWDEYDSDHKTILWQLFNSQQRSAMKKLLAYRGAEDVVATKMLQGGI